MKSEKINGYHIVRGYRFDVHKDNHIVAVWKGIDRIEYHTHIRAIDAEITYHEMRIKYMALKYKLADLYPSLFDRMVRG